MLFISKVIYPDFSNHIHISFAKSKYFFFRKIISKNLILKKLYFHISFNNFLKKNKKIKLSQWYFFINSLYSNMHNSQIMHAFKAMDMHNNIMPLKILIKDAISNLNRGEYIYSLFLKKDLNFHAIFTKLLESAEKGNYLELGLFHIKSILQLSIQTRREITKSLMYPFILVTFICIFLFVTNLIIIPEFENFLIMQNINISSISFIFSISHNFLQIFSIFSLISIIILVFLKKNNISLLSILSEKTLGNSMKYALFSMELSMLLKHNMNLMEALKIALDNNLKHVSYTKILQKLHNGVSLDYLFEEFDEYFSNSISNAILSNTLQSTLSDLHSYYFEKYKDKLNTITKFIEPVCIICVAVIILILAFLLFVPINKILQLIEY